MSMTVTWPALRASPPGLTVPAMSIANHGVPVELSSPSTAPVSCAVVTLSEYQLTVRRATVIAIQSRSPAALTPVKTWRGRAEGGRRPVLARAPARGDGGLPVRGGFRRRRRRLSRRDPSGLGLEFLQRQL